MKKNRLTIIGIVLVLAFGLLISRLFNMTLVNGQTYRDQADNTRKKQINEKAARGNIYDRNGELLAGNKAVYNLNVYKDRFNTVSKSEKNKVLLDLVHILEEDGVSYLDDFFLGVYVYKYDKNIDYFLNEETPTSKMVNIIDENQLISDIAKSRVEIGLTDNLYYYPINRIIDYLDSRGKSLPIEVKTDGKIEVNFVENDKYDELKRQGVITDKTTAFDLLMDTISKDKSLSYYLLEHPLTRKLVYDVCQEKGIETGIKLSEIEYMSDLKYIENKAKLNKLSNNITMDSKVKDDFISLVKDNTVDSLLTMVSFDEDKNPIVPAELLINQLNAIGVESEVTYEVDKENSTVKLVYSDGQARVETPVDYLIRLANENDILDKFIINSSVVDLAEKSLFNNSIYPRISRKDDEWKYIFEVEKADLLQKYDKEGKITAAELFNIYMDNYQLKGYGMYEAFGIISIYQKINAQGYKGYEPLTLAKNISDRTLVEVEEKMPKDLGFEIVVQPSRYYPNDNSFSHMLGYLGKISDEVEMKEYIENRKYSHDDVIGKTGLEESFEDTLRGVNGKTFVYTDVAGNTTDVIEKHDPIPGNNLYTTIDINFQKDVEAILRDLIYAKSKGIPYKSYYGDVRVIEVPEVESGAVVVTDLKTGGILASASYPDYDPNMFVNGISNNDWEQLTRYQDGSIYAGKPLMNLVTQGAMPPGSTFKTVTSLAALENGLDPNQPITCYGFIDLKNTRFNCLVYTNTGRTHGPTDLYRALQVSCNYYFYSLGLGYNPKKDGELDIKVSLSDIEETVDELGMNKVTGVEVNIPAESVGYSPSLYGKQNLVRSMLRDFLNKNLDKYVKDGVDKRDNEIKSDSKTILSWVENGGTMTRSEVISSVDSLGYEALEPLKGQYSGLADKIKYDYLDQAVWTDADSLNMVIGQGQNAYTPIQMNQLVATIANEGVRVKPTLVKEIKNYDNTKEVFKKDAEKTVTSFNPENFKHIKEGMRRAAVIDDNHKKLPFDIGVKTGTADSDSINPETGEVYKEFTWEIAFAPFKEPEIAVTFVVMQGKMSVDSALGVNDVIYSYYKNVKKDPEFKNEREVQVQVQDPKNNTNN